MDARPPSPAPEPRDLAGPSADTLIAEMARDGQPAPRDLGPDRPTSEASGGALKRGVSYTHDAMIDQLIANPMISQGALAAYFGYTQAWVSTIMGSDAFRARLEMRRDELIDPSIRMTIEERFKALAQKSLEVLQAKLNAPTVSDNLAIQAASLAQKALGLGQGPTPVPAAPDRLERLGGRLLALMGERAVRTLDQPFVDVPSRQLEPSPAGAPEEL